MQRGETTRSLQPALNTNVFGFHIRQGVGVMVGYRPVAQQYSSRPSKSSASIGVSGPLQIDVSQSKGNTHQIPSGCGPDLDGKV
jgi:hypothetical protein